MRSRLCPLLRKSMTEKTVVRVPAMDGPRPVSTMDVVVVRAAIALILP